jgi:hypothetical protein
MKHDHAPDSVRVLAAEMLQDVRSNFDVYGWLSPREQYEYAANLAEDISWNAPLGRVDHQLYAQVQWLLNFRIRTRPGVARFVAMNKGWRIEE